MTGTLKTDRRAGQVVDPSDINDIASDANSAHVRLNTLTLDALLDVSVPSPANGYILTWVAAESLWRALPAPATGGGGAVSSVNTKVGAVTLTKADIGLDQADNTSDANKPASQAVLGLLGGKADLISGKIPNSQLPSLVITEYLGTVASNAAMLALTGQRGDFVTRTDSTVMSDGLPAVGDWILTADVPSTLSNWHRLVGPASSSAGTVTLANMPVGYLTTLSYTDAMTLTTRSQITTRSDVRIGVFGGASNATRPPWLADGDFWLQDDDSASIYAPITLQSPGASVDADSRINGAIAFAKRVELGEGTFLLAAPLTPLTGKQVLDGQGMGTVLQIKSTYSGGNLITLNGKRCTVANLQIVGGPSTTSCLTNPAIGAAIALGLGASYAKIKDIDLTAVNGWCVEGLGSITGGMYGLEIDGIRGDYNGAGFHILGISSSNYAVQGTIKNIDLQILMTGDLFLFEDANDIQVGLANGSVAGNVAGASGIRVRGVSSSIIFTNVDIGSSPGVPSVAPIVKIEANDTGGIPNNIQILGGIIQSGLVGIQVDAGFNLDFSHLQISRSGGAGILINGGTNIGITDNTFTRNGYTAGASNRDIQFTTAVPEVNIDRNRFETPVGTASQQTASVLGLTSSTNLVAFRDNRILGGHSQGVVFNGGTPKWVRGNMGYNPLGWLTAAQAPIPATTQNTSGSSVDRTWYITAAAGGSTTVSVTGGPGANPALSVVIPANTMAAIFQPSGGSVLNFVYGAGNAPTAVVYGN